jgi:hypothetical protein
VDKRGINKVLKSIIKKRQKRERRKREEANQNEYNKKPRVELHTYGYFEYQNGVG